MNNIPPPADYDENPEWTGEDFARARPASEVLPPDVAAVLVRRRGPQSAPTKKVVTLRLDPDVLDKFRATGPGWQSRMNEALRQAKV
ncbi:BrnA antitoxin family protein [Sphingomonas sp. PB2P12]|uniref:BrnA antitoxin family protein n=1 Tax=Sphingomonas sandaracina TaxID=3096157 RepID=UPI002FC83E97